MFSVETRQFRRVSRKQTYTPYWGLERVSRTFVKLCLDDARELHTCIRVCQYTYAHLSDGDQLAMLDVFPLRGIDLFKVKMPTSLMGIDW
ncbi:hypothetical protein EMCRGX_G006166 [Ephydatia muelleri]